ncbi:MAG: hypothetical protein H5T47_02305 [Archaeoglobi archaeon]|nr:hypothetical protein [Candidatus Mnemosynella bozhongmuii]
MLAGAFRPFHSECFRAESSEDFEEILKRIIPLKRTVIVEIPVPEEEMAVMSSRIAL